VLNIFVSIAVAIVVIKLLLLWFEPQMAFFPVRGVQQTPAALSLSFEDLRIQTQDGETLHGWWLEHPAPRAQVIFWHGNGGNLSMWLDLLADLRRRGFSVLAVDYRGYGISTGTPSERGIYLDADATVREFERRFRRRTVPTIYWGRSIGASVAASSTTAQRPDALILDSPMADVRSIFRTNPVMWTLSLLTSYRFPTTRFLQRYDGPLLVIHGDRDTIIPFASGQQVFASAPSRQKTFVTMRGADHNDLDVVDARAYWRAVDGFIAKIDTPR